MPYAQVEHSARRPTISEADSLGELFDRIREVKYVTLGDWQKLPVDFPKPNQPIIILTSNFSTIESLWQLLKGNGQSLWNAQLSTGKSVPVRILEKGKAVFPEQFESQLLSRAVFHQNCIKVPGDMELPFVRLYWRLFYENLFGGPDASQQDKHDRRILMEMVTNQTGLPMRPRYKFLTFTK